MSKYPPQFTTTGELRKIYQTWADMRWRCSPIDREYQQAGGFRWAYVEASL